MATSETTDYLAPVRNVKGALGRAMIALDTAGAVEQKAIADELLAALNDPGYKRFRDSFGKLVFMMPSDFPGVRDVEGYPEGIYIHNFRDLASHTTFIRVFAEGGRLGHQVVRDSIIHAYVAHQLAEVYAEDINEAFRQRGQTDGTH